MHCTNEITIDSDLDTIFKLGAEIERWPRLLPHYRSVKLLRQEGNRCVAHMAASRDGIPVSWTCAQERDAETPRILFHHIGGFTRGMAVAWTFEERDEQVIVRITHQFQKGWPLQALDRFVSEKVVGDFFVANIADKTLQSMKLLAERDPVAYEGSGALEPPA